MYKRQGPVLDKELETLTMHPTLNNFRPALKQKQALIEISRMPQGMIFIACAQAEIIGYVTFHHPDPYTRWGKHPAILEMGGIEISPDWRKFSIGGNLLCFSFAAEELNDFIVITMEYAWHWDLRNSHLDMWGYQKMLTHIFSKAGLEPIHTDDPDILDHPCNVLMAKVGKHVNHQYIEQFEALKFMRNQPAPSMTS